MRLCLLALVLVLAVPAAALADTTVDPAFSGTCARDATCKTITDAIGVANGGDTIKVLKGSYAENVSVPSGKDNLVLAFDPGAAVTGTGSAAAVTVASAGVKLNGIVVIKAAGTDPAVSATGGKLNLIGATVLATGGDAVTVSGADNLIQRSTIASTAAADGADAIAQGPGGLTVDSSILVGGAKGDALRVTTAQGSDAATTTLNHVTAVSAGGIALEAPDAGLAQVQKTGDITLAVNASIIHGTSTAFESDGQPNPLPGLPPLAAPSVVKATYANSDATQMTKATDSPGDPEITGSGNPTADSALFRNAALRLKATAPVIDKGGPKGTESDTDIDGDPRTNGAATDIGADEFTNHPPTLALTLSPASAKTGAVVTATGVATDPEGADDIKGYFVDWGDGTKATSQFNTAQHVYNKAGTYTVSMLVADQSFATSAPVTKSITLTDGQAPQLQVTTPGAGKTVKLGKGKKRKALTIKGVDSDESGLASVEIALTKAGSKCKQYTGSKLKSASCTKFTFVKAKLKGSGFSLVTKKKLKLPKGTYEIRARATDTVGNASSTFDKTTKTLVTFKIK